MMATWVTHFRIAEALISRDLPVSRIDFLVGNIGPDCGLIGEDGKPTPPKEITHFMMNRVITAESFYEQYLLDPIDISSPKGSYYLGYYFHLVTDEEWIKLANRKKKKEVFQSILNTPEYTPLVKKDWYGHDFVYLKENKESIFWTEFQHIDEYPEFLSFFPAGQTSQQIRNITEFYHESSIAEDHEFIYLTREDIDGFVNHTVHLLCEIVRQRMNMGGLYV
ncbi:hypothetical protein C7Y44_09615 [Paenibacillus popilliae]|uniref:Zinc dependent phospholipase C n=2 Tax=Paenibacillus popilliae TaxID=78057 RepID=A0ABY3ATW4_PAEPP|nr:hypothetical protein C7Y44_09615 [Paenibacillus sp. SDF0028]